MDYKIIATHTTTHQGHGWECSVAIESSPGHWKAYRATVPDYPTWDDVLETARAGTKAQPATAAKTFAHLPKKTYE